MKKRLMGVLWKGVLMVMSKMRERRYATAVKLQGQVYVITIEKYLPVNEFCHQINKMMAEK
ncbi:MAG: hypothetical protein NC123_17035 [Butyrivibrio sp.]|nr:hypothetical protein [Acetatifactor muris]MCM1561224.1 hypothetical protein [Butyrivibrio sp.]